MADTTSPALARFRIILWTLVVVAAVAATVVFFTRQGPNAPLGVTGKPFALESTQGGTFTEASLKGTPSLVFFGYTHCPDVCPTTLAESAAWKEQLGLSPEQLRIIFVTVDPARDTRNVLADYLSSFPGTIGLVGTDQQTADAKASFGVMSEATAPDADGYYLVNHTASVFLINRDGRFEGTIAYGESKDTAVAKIRKLIAS
ncbi:MAG: SCO family protein [Devosia sp.]|uniref:SCO family protein n=1 Tax=Devosia sp. TaxID=1871048 RepID=UPI001ACE852E|nr:SCO family protein [Devosia sp.]MBN9315820.1 SCO family protein [Devosia sp.]